MAQESDKTTQDNLTNDTGGYIEAKNKCPHVANSCRVPENGTFKELANLIKNPLCCITTCDKTECWFCLSCHELFCSRYSNKHMNIHYTQSVNKSHCIAMGIGDLSFWCFDCDSYINHLTIPAIFEIYELAHIAKHGESIPKQLLKETKFDQAMDTDNDSQMTEYHKLDTLDHSHNNDTHSLLLNELNSAEHKSCIEWNNESNTPNLDPILSNLNHLQLFIGTVTNSDSQNSNTNSSNANDMWKYFSSRNGLTKYSLFANIASKTKLEYIKQSIDNNVFLDRCIGSLYGMGIGDATGAPLEFIPCVREFGNSFFRLKGTKKWINEQNAFGLKRGQWTDDAAMGLCMADSLIVHAGYNGSDIRMRFYNWWNNGYNNAFRLDDVSMGSSVGLGGNISKSIYSMREGQIPTPIFITNTSKDDSGNGSLMRLAPIPVFFSHFMGGAYNDKQMCDIALEYAKQSSFTTHPGYIAAEACAFMSFVVINAIHRPTNAYSNIKVFLEEISAKYVQRLEFQLRAYQSDLEQTIKSKQFNYVKDKVTELSLNAKNGTNFDKSMQETLLNKDESNNNFGQTNAKYYTIAWEKIQTDLNLIHRKIIALKYMIRLIKSSESDESTERCWNWKCKYGDLGIDKTMVNRGSNYNGYPNTQGYFGSYCMDGLAMGLHSLYNSQSFGDSIMKAVNLLGDADSTGSITGQMSGAWYGFKDVFYDTNAEMFLFKQIAQWDDYEFGVRAILLFCLGQTFAEKTFEQIQIKAKEKEKKSKGNDKEQKKDE